MRWTILLTLLASGIFLGILNNLVNPNGVPWTGSPPVFPKPAGWPDLSAVDGFRAGLEVARKSALQHWPAILVALVLLFGGRLWMRRLGRAPFRWTMSWWRVLFGLMFLAAGLPKFLDPQGFALMVAQYQMLPGPVVHPFSVLLPAVEIVTGLALLFSPWEKESSFLLGLMMLMFIVALAQALARGLGIACGCFDIKGATDAGESWYSLIRDIVLLPAIAWMWIRSETRFLWRL